MEYNVRLATVADSEGILRIYAPYITDTVVSFETDVPTVDAFSARIERISVKYPFLVCEAVGGIIGYAYASQHRERAAYLYDADVSIYVLPEYHGTGIAGRLYDCLFAILAALGYKNIYAAYAEPNIKSFKFHQKFEFSVIGTHHKTGYKFGRWHDVTWLEKRIGGDDVSPGGVLAINEIPNVVLDKIFWIETPTTVQFP